MQVWKRVERGGRIWEKKYLEVKGKFSEAVYQAKCEAERNRFADIIGNGLKYEVFLRSWN